AIDLDALTDSDKTVPEAVAGRAADAIVADLELKLVGLIPNGDLGDRCTRVLERVGQPLLDDSIAREIDGPRERERLTVDAKAYGGAAPHPLGHQGVEALEPRLRRQLRALTVTPHCCQEAAHLGQCRAPGPLDAVEGISILPEVAGKL